MTTTKTTTRQEDFEKYTGILIEHMDGRFQALDERLVIIENNIQDMKSTLKALLPRHNTIHYVLPIMKSD